MKLPSLIENPQHHRASPVPHGSRYRYAKRRYRMLFGLLDAICRPVFRIARSVARSRLPGDPRSILVVQLDHIGDAVLTTPMLRALHERFPGAAIDVLASQCNRQVFESNPHVREVHVSEFNWHAREPGKQSYFAEVARLGRTLRRNRYELGIDPRGDFLVTLVLWLAGITRRLGWACGGCAFLLTDIATWDSSRHEADARRALLEPLGIVSAQRKPELFPSWADDYQIRESLAALTNLRRPVVVVHAGAGTPAKRWPDSHLAGLLKGLIDCFDASVILVGGPRDQCLAKQLARAHDGVFDWTGRLTLMQLAALTAEADLFIGPDSGPAHIASAMGTPSVVLFSGTNRAECWTPVGPRVRVVRHAVPCSPCHLKECPIAGHPCMSEISPGEVLLAARDVMNETIADEAAFAQRISNDARCA